MAKKRATRDAAPGEAPDAYSRHRDKMAAASRDRSAAGREIGELPKVKDPKRRARCSKSLKQFLETYFTGRFTLVWSADHVKVITKIERAIVSGGLFALSMARGSGKTTICEGAILFAALFGYHLFPVLLGATAEASIEMLDSIKAELEGNDLLYEDFPEVCHAIRALEGQAQRCKGQTYNGERTLVQWKKNFIVLPRIPNSKASEVCIKVAGITGRVRGMKYTRSDGKIVRPSLALIDDPQTDDSAYSVQQCSRRLKTLNGAILKLCGPGKKMSAVCPCTVIRRGDVADKLLDRDANPHWQGERCKMLYAFPARMDLWQQYAIFRAESLRAGGDGQPARDFYAQHRKAMDSGAEVAWPQRFDPDDASALETAMKLFFEDKYSFMAECQNEPEDEELGESDLKPADVVSRFSGRDRGVAPIWAGKVTAFVDVQKSSLWWLVAGWDPSNFTGAALDYGVWPEQPGRRYFSLGDLQHTLQTKLPGVGIEGQIRYGLEQLAPRILGREWSREGGTALRVDRLFVDAGFETETVYEWARATSFAASVVPSHGRAIGAKNKPMDQFLVKPGERKGFHWFLTTGANKRAIRHVLIDVNFWKSFLVQRLRQAIGEPGAWSLFGSRRGDTDHDMIADHLCAERSVLVEANGRKVAEWEVRPGRPDNHWLDCFVGAAAAASFEGVVMAGQGGTAKKRGSWRERQQRKIHG